MKSHRTGPVRAGAGATPWFTGSLIGKQTSSRESLCGLLSLRDVIPPNGCLFRACERIETRRPLVPGLRTKGLRAASESGARYKFSRNVAVGGCVRWRPSFGRTSLQRCRELFVAPSSSPRDALLGSVILLSRRHENSGGRGRDEGTARFIAAGLRAHADMSRPSRATVAKVMSAQAPTASTSSCSTACCRNWTALASSRSCAGTASRRRCSF